MHIADIASSARDANIRYWQARMTHNTVYRNLGTLADVADMVARDTDYRHAQLCSGPPGIGKTTVVRKILERAGRRHITLSAASAEGLAETLARTSSRRQVLVVDDGRLLDDKRTIDVLQIAVTPPQARQPYRSVTKRDGSVTRDFSHAMVFVLTNKNLESLPEAFTSRFQAPTIIPNDRKAIFEFTCYLTICRGLIDNVDGRGLPLKLRQEVFGLFCAHQHLLPDVSPRVLRDWVTVAQQQPASWRARISRKLEAGTDCGVRIATAQLPVIVV